ncbi:hypothetical protein ACRRTK_014177 [Alexandromys fortis]
MCWGGDCRSPSTGLHWLSLLKATLEPGLLKWPFLSSCVVSSQTSNTLLRFPNLPDSLFEALPQGLCPPSLKQAEPPCRERATKPEGKAYV